MDYDERCRMLDGKVISIAEFIETNKDYPWSKIFLFPKGRLSRKIGLSELIEIQDTLEPNGTFYADYEYWEDERGRVHEGRELNFEVKER